MSQYGGGSAKNPPWARQNQQSMGLGVSQQMQSQTQIMSQLGNNAATMLQYPQAQMYQQPQLGQLQQTGMAMQAMGTLGGGQISTAGGLAATMQPAPNSIQQQQLYSQVGTVSYPTRAIITSPYGSGTGSQSGSVQSGGGNQSVNSGNSQKQRVFTGTVTKVQDNFGFVDDEVFFQTSCCVKGSNPQVGDRVLVEAMYNASMPFKWNATRIQVLPMDRTSEMPVAGRGRFSNVPPPSEELLSGMGGGGSGGGGDFGNRNRNRNNKRNRRSDVDDFDRKRRRDDRDRRSVERREEKEKEKEKERPKSPPPRKRSKTPRRRKARIVPRYMVQIPKIALDMPEADVLEIKKRYTNLYIPSDFFVSSFKWVEGFPPYRPLTLERPCAFHVMHKDVDPVVENDAVLEPPDLDYRFSAKVMLLSMVELDDIYKKCCVSADEKEGSDEKDYVHPTRLINFLVGLRGKNETMAIGGPWSPSLDGPNPDKDPTVLIKTAIRSCKALTGIDLSNCSQWYRFLEIYYHRAESVHKGKTVPARVETVVLYLPDVWSCQPTRLEWDGLHLNYKKQLDRLLNQDDEPEADDKDTSIGEIQKKEPTHFSQLDPKVMKVNELREELEARSLSPKGLKSQLHARLAKALKTEQEKEEEANAAKKNAGQNGSKTEKDEREEEKRKLEEEEKRKLDEKERQLLEKRHTLPEKSHILVHPSKVAKSGKFDCTIMSLSILLDYRPEDSKEHSFEVSLFAELFNEMLMRDFGFCIYKALMAAPEKSKEDKDDKDKSKDKKSDRDKDKKDHDDKKDDKNSVEDDEASGDDEDKRDKKEDKKKKERVKLVTVDPYLLLAFVYFDQTHCGYIFDKDLEELLFTLGLNLSRAQVKKLVQKVVSRDSLHYRKLTDKPKDESTTTHNGDMNTDDLMTLSLGNKRMFPIFDEGVGSSPNSKRNRKGGSEKKESSELPSGFAMYNGSLLDINKLQAQHKRSEESRHKTEKVLEKLRSEHSQIKESNNKHLSTIKKLTADLKDFKERLTNTNSELCTIDGKTKLYFSTMMEIYEKLTPIVGSKSNTKEEIIEEVEMEDVMHSASHKSHNRAKITTSQKTVLPESENRTPKVEKKSEKSPKPQNDSKSESPAIKTEHNIKDIKVEEDKETAENKTDKKSQASSQSKEQPIADNSVTSKQDTLPQERAPSKTDEKPIKTELSEEESEQQGSSPVTKNVDENQSAQDVEKSST